MSARPSKPLLVLVLVWAVVLMPALASAQSAFTGTVTDNTGGVLPGVTVEAASAVLIEGSKSVVTNAEGRYTIVDLRPGTYSVTFTLTGFGTVVVKDAQLPTDFTSTLNAQLSVGALNESVTVLAASPTVDVSSAARVQVLSREVLDTIPTSRTGQGIGAIIPGIRLSRPDMGGTRATENATMAVHGSSSRDVNVNVDGLSIDVNAEGLQGYYNEQLFQEVSFTTDAVSAESSKGGVRMNMIAREGGNIFSGSSYISGSSPKWQSSNITQALKDRGLPTANGISQMADMSVSEGGPVLKNRLWFFVSGRTVQLDEIIPDAFYVPAGTKLTYVPPTSGDPAIADQFVNSLSARVTNQLIPNHKLSAFMDYAFKYKGHSPSPSDDPATASLFRDWRTHVYYSANVKWTATLSNRLLLETGYSAGVQNYLLDNQPGVNKTRGSAEWYAQAQHSDIITGRDWNSIAITRSETGRFLVSSSASYVTGSHNFKSGFQWFFGNVNSGSDRMADLTQRYRSGVPESVIVENTPRMSKVRMKADLGVFAQDSWTVKRMTINPGVRFEYFNASFAESYMAAGRFAPARFQVNSGAIPEWFDVAPRFSLVYDLFGDASTAIKFSASKYMRSTVASVTSRYSPVGSSTDTRDWFDVDLIPGTSTRSGVAKATDGDDIAQDSEIGPSNQVNFGLAANRSMDPDLQREYTLAYSTSIQRQVLPGVSVTGAWYRRSSHDTYATRNTLVSLSDYARFDAPSPIDGTPVTIYNLNVAKRGQSFIFDTNSDTNTEVYNGFELSFTARMPNGSGFFGGTTAERTVANACDTDNPNLLRYCNESQLDIPFLSEYKLAGFYPLPGGVVANMSFISWPGTRLRTDWTPATTVFPGGQRTESVVINLAAPGTKFTERYNQFDVGVKKIFKFGRLEVQGDATVFNVLNTSAVLAEITAFGSRLGTPQQVPQGRLLRLATQLKW